jgi:hypothetical protein
MLLCRYLILCEYASRDLHGRITLHNLFNRINAFDFPVSHHPFAVAIELTSLRQSVVNQQLAIRVLALDEMNHEEVILEADSNRVSVRVGQTVGMTLNIGRPIFDEPGGLSFACRPTTSRWPSATSPSAGSAGQRRYWPARSPTW